MLNNVYGAAATDCGVIGKNAVAAQGTVPITLARPSSCFNCLVTGIILLGQQCCHSMALRANCQPACVALLGTLCIALCPDKLCG